MKKSLGAILVALFAGGGIFAFLNYRDQKNAKDFDTGVKRAVVALLEGHQTRERAAHATDFYAFPLTAFYSNTNYGEDQYQKDAAEFWTMYEYVDVGIVHTEITMDSDKSGYVHVIVDATISRRRIDRGCVERGDGKYLLTLEHLDVGYRIKSEGQTVTPLNC